MRAIEANKGLHFVGTNVGIDPEILYGSFIISKVKISL